MSKNNPIPFSNCKIHPFERVNMSNNQPILITIQRQITPSIQEVTRKAAQRSVVPPFAWKDVKFEEEYSRLVDSNMMYLGPNADLKAVCSLLH